ncbi:cupin domain-containing protein [Streptomyces sp. NPDC005820]|uniref:cupin domain-containing protein n=1 Tax=Streptomyces sp. NPDC005820 TaxID=3157069 RepID=UPI00340EBB54
MARMTFVRPLDIDQAFDTGFKGYRAQFLSHLESALMIASTIEEGGCGPGLHYHRSDQLYYLMTGSMKVRLGDEVHQVRAGSLVFIPAGLAHCNWNEGPGTETHFEMIIPAPAPMAQIAIMVDSPADIPAEDRTDRRGYVRTLDPAALPEALPGFRMQPLADPESGSHGAVVNYLEVDPGRAGPGTHVHEFDQYYLVLEGRLTIEVALEKHIAEPGTLVILPAGVPHRQYNEGDVTEKHLGILTPAPEPGRPWDRGVDFAANGDDHGGTTNAPAAAPSGATR